MDEFLNVNFQLCLNEVIFMLMFVIIRATNYHCSHYFQCNVYGPEHIDYCFEILNSFTHTWKAVAAWFFCDKTKR